VEIVNVRITTITDDNVARRCDGCLEVIAGTPWRINILDIVAPERAADWTDQPMINPGPFQFHPDPDHVRRWMASKGYSSVARAKSARSCGRSRCRRPMAPLRAGACATASTATTTRSCLPDS
jgi:hypothetical protein